MTDLERDARRYSYRLLSYRGRSENELREKLSRKGFPDAIIGCTIESLKISGYLDDSSLAGNLIREAFERKHLGYQAARAFMLQRGLSREVVESSLDYNEDLELENAQKLLDKKLRSMGNYLTAVDKRKLWNFLSRRGFSFPVIQKVFKKKAIHEEAEE